MPSNFTEFNIFVSASFRDIDPAETGLSFVSNVFIEGNKVWWTHAGGKSGGDFQSFFTRLRIDQHFIFGPPRKQKTWPLVMLEEIGAVGVYRVSDNKKGISTKAARPRSLRIAR